LRGSLGVGMIDFLLFLGSSKVKGLFASLKILYMQTIQKIIQQTNKKSKLNNLEATKKVIQAFLETIQQNLVQGENIHYK
jgi:hypothetical protein